MTRTLRLTDDQYAALLKRRKPSAALKPASALDVEYALSIPVTPCPTNGPQIAQNRPSKYRNHRTIGGHASLKEGRRAAQLKLLLAAGQVRELLEQVPYVLIPVQLDPVTGKCIERACKYVADFVFLELQADGSWVRVTEDVKSPASRTKDYIIKRKLMLHVHGIRVRES